MQAYNSYGEWARANGVAIVTGRCPKCGGAQTFVIGASADSSIDCECGECGAKFKRSIVRIKKGEVL